MTHQTLHRPAKATRKGNGAKFDETDAGLAARPDQHDDSVDLADPGLLAINHLFVEKVADQLHDQLPNISSGMLTMASRKPSTMMTMTAALPNMPLRNCFT